MQAGFFFASGLVESNRLDQIFRLIEVRVNYISRSVDLCPPLPKPVSISILLTTACTARYSESACDNVPYADGIVL